MEKGPETAEPRNVIGLPTKARNGPVNLAISREIVRLHSRLYGRGPTKAKTYVHREYVLCALDDIFTTAETTLIESGRADLVRETRAAFQLSQADEFTGIVERATGRRVRAFHSQIHPESMTATEVFLLEVEDLRDGSKPATVVNAS